MSLRVVSLPSLADELDLFVPPRDQQPLPVSLPPQELIEIQLRGGYGNPCLCSCGRRKAHNAQRCQVCRKQGR